MDREITERILQVNSSLDELPRITMFLEDMGEETGLSMAHVLSLNLVLEEALTNIINYGFDDGSDHIIEVRFRNSGNQLTIVVIDDGSFFDPTLSIEPDITLPAEERPEGGLGIFLIKKIMDTVEYQRKENKNYLTLKKTY
jgi:serine/threonine-protein kinase RsbW